MRFGVAVPAYGRYAGERAGELGALLTAIEDLGYEGVWFADHVAVPAYAAGRLAAPFLEPLALCAFTLGHTTRLRAGTDVLVAPYRHPLTVAASAATMAHLSPGRLVLGVGVGYLRGEFEALGAGPYEERGRRTDEALRAIRAAWTEPGATDLRVAIPPDPGVPLWAGGNAPAAERRAALLADGWHPLWCTPDAYRAARARITALRSEAGRAGAFTFSYSSPGMRLGTPLRPAPPGTGEFAYAPALITAAGGRPWLQGTAGQLVDDLGALADAGVEHVTVRFGAALDQLERFAAEVAPRLR